MSWINLVALLQSRYVVLFPSISTFETVGMGWTLPLSRALHVRLATGFRDTVRPMLALAMLSLPCLGDACTYSVLTRCGTEYRAPQMA